MTAIDRSDPDRAQPGAAADLATCLRLVARGDADAFDAVYDQVAARVGSRLATVASGRVAAAVSPTAANTAMPAMP